MALDEIFVGREKELELFRNSFSKQFHEEETFLHKILKRKKKQPPAFAQIFLFYGEGGLGKSSLLKACLREAQKVAQNFRADVKFIYLDWDDYFAKKSTLPNTSRKMMNALYTVFIETDPAVNSCFTDYQKRKEEIAAVEKKAEDIKKSDKDWSEEVGKILDTTAGYVPAPDLLKDTVKEVAKPVLSYAANQLHERFIEWLRERKKLKIEELNLYENQDYILSKALVKGLRKMSSRSPVVLAVDTFEQVDEQDLEEWMRTSFLNELYNDEFTGVTTIIAGRNNHSRKYRSTFPETILHYMDLDSLLFTEVETAALAKAYGLSISPAQVQAISNDSLGIPLVIKDALGLLKDGAISSEELLADLQNRRGSVREIIHGMVERFLKYAQGDDKEKIFQFAMLRVGSMDVLPVLWKTEEKQTKELFEKLSEKYSFMSISKKELHKTVYNFLKTYLINQLDFRFNSEIRKDIQRDGKILAGYHEQNIRQLDEIIPNIEERYSDERYELAILGYFNGLLWYSQDEAFKYLYGFMLECLQFNYNLAKEIVAIFYDFVNVLTTPHKKVLKTIADGLYYFQLLNFSSFSLPPYPEVKAMVDHMATKESGLNDMQKGLLKLRIAEIYCGNHQYAEAFSLFEACEKLLLNLEESRVYLYDCYFDLGYYTKEPEDQIKYYHKALTFKEDEYVLNNLGVAYNAALRHEDAITYYKKVLEIAPAYVSAFHGLGYSYGLLKQQDQAILYYQKALELDPYNAVFYHGLGVAYLDVGDNDKAIYYFQEATRIKPGYFEAWHNLGLVAERQKQYTEAIQHYQKALEIKPDYAVGYYGLGNCYYSLQDYGKAIEAYQKVIALDAAYRNGWYALGLSFSQMQNQQEAVSSFQKAIALKADDYEAWHNLGVAYENQGELATAVQHYQKALEIKPDYADSWNGLGNCYFALQDYTKAEESYQKAIAANPEFLYARHNLGLVAERQKQYTEAIQHYQKALEIKPDYAVGYYGLGNCYYSLQDYGKAIEAYQKVVALDAAYRNGWYALGLSFSQMQNQQEAVSSFQKAIALKEDDYEAWNGLGYTYYSHKDYDEALKCYHKSLEINPAFALALSNLGLIYYEQGDMEAALSFFGKAVEADASYYEAWNYYGVVLAKRKELNHAFNAFEQALTLKPGYDEALYNMAGAYSIHHDKQKALDYLKKAIHLNPEHKNFVKEDKDFRWLWKEKEFEEIIHSPDE